MERKKKIHKNTLSRKIVAVLISLLICLSGSVVAFAASGFTVEYRPGTVDAVENMPEAGIGTAGEVYKVSDLSPQREGFEFLGWILAYQEAEYTSYEVRYLEEGTNAELAEPKIVNGQMVGTEVTEIAVEIDGYELVGEATQKVVLSEKDNVISFYYKTVKELASYTVHYVDTEGNPLAEDKVVTGQEAGMVITETAIAIEGYTPLAPAEQTLELQEGSNELTFVYEVYEKEATYRVTYDLNGGYGNLPVDETEYRAGDMVTVTEEYNIEVEKGIFSGYWSKEPLPMQNPNSFIGEGCYEIGTTFEMGDEDVTLYAVHVGRMD